MGDSNFGGSGVIGVTLRCGSALYVLCTYLKCKTHSIV